MFEVFGGNDMIFLVGKTVKGQLGVPLIPMVFIVFSRDSWGL